jgi:hypothetical protein
MANWKRVLLSGSHFTVNELTISDIDSAASTNTILFAGSASLAGSGSFKTLSSLALDGTTTLDFTDGTFSGSFSGSGAGLTDISATAEESLKAGAGLYILKQTGGGEGQSGSPFSGNQASNLTAKLKGSSAGSGYADAGDDTNNTQGEVNSYNTNVNGGVIFTLAETVGDNVDIALATGSLAGDGLTFTTNFNILGLELDTSANADTTFDLGSNGLKIAGAFAGNGLTLSSGILGIDLASNSGLTVTDVTMTSGKLALASSVAGNGLTFGDTANDRSNLSIDPSVVVTGSGDDTSASNTIKINSEGPNVGGVFDNTIRDATSAGRGVIFVNNTGDSGDTAGTPDILQTFTGTQPSYEFTLRKNFGTNDDATDQSDVTFENNVTMSGDLTVISSSNVTNLQVDEFQTSDAFILINSGSGGGPTYPNKEGGIIVDRGPGSGSAVLYSSGSTQRLFAITNPTNASGIVQWNDTSVISTGVPNTHVQSISLVYTGSTSDPVSNDPAFANTEKFGSWYIEGDRNPAGGESNVWIYTDDFERGGGGGD